MKPFLMVLSTRMMIPTKIAWKIIMLESSCWKETTWNIHYKDFSTDDVVENPFHPCKFHALGSQNCRKFYRLLFKACRRAESVPWKTTIDELEICSKQEGIPLTRIGGIFLQNLGIFQNFQQHSATKNSPGFFWGDLPLPNKTGAQNMDLKFPH